MDKRTVQSITTLFMAYGKNEPERMAIYCKMLADVPADVLSATVEKAVIQNKFLPTIAELREAVKSLCGSVNASQRVKPWVEAQKEIQKGITRTWFHGCLGEDVPDELYGKTCDPKWSTPEIKAAVDSYGFDNLGKVLENDMPIVWAQLRNAYEQACNASKEKETNAFVLNGREQQFKELVGKVSGFLK